MDASEKIAELERKYNGQSAKFNIFKIRYNRLMAMSDTELRIYNANESGVCDNDAIFSTLDVDDPFRDNILRRNVSEKEYKLRTASNEQQRLDAIVPESGHTAAYLRRFSEKHNLSSEEVQDLAGASKRYGTTLHALGILMDGGYSADDACRMAELRCMANSAFQDVRSNKDTLTWQVAAMFYETFAEGLEVADLSGFLERLRAAYGTEVNKALTSAVHVSRRYETTDMSEVCDIIEDDLGRTDLEVLKDDDGSMHGRLTRERPHMEVVRYFLGQ